MEFVESLQNALPTYINVFIAVFRYAAPVLALLILARAILPLLRFRREPEIWAWLCFDDGKKIPITHWENVIGRHKNSDVVLDLATVSRNHAVLTRYDDGSWTIADVESVGGVRVNGKKVSIHAIKPEDVISIGGVEMQLQPISEKQEKRLAQLRTKASSYGTSFANVVLLSVFQALCCIGYLMTGEGRYAASYCCASGCFFCSIPLSADRPLRWKPLRFFSALWECVPSVQWCPGRRSSRFWPWYWAL